MNIERLMARLLPDAPTIVEIGAHHLEDTRWMRLLWPEARIVAIEADPRNVAHVRQQKVAELLKVEFVALAIGDGNGECDWHPSTGHCRVRHADGRSEEVRDWDFSSSLLAPAQEHLRRWPGLHFGQAGRVQATRLDDLCRERRIEAIDLLWMDVQGAEHLVIAGGTEALRRTRYLYTEYSNTPWYEGQKPLGDLLQMLSAPAGKPCRATEHWRIYQQWETDVLLQNGALD